MNNPRDDRIYLFTRFISAVVIFVLIMAFVALYFLPGHTDFDFAWTILPPTTAMIIGSGYMAGAYFFARLLLDTKWHRVQVGFLPITVFTIAMLAATLLHLSRFHLGTFIFYLWTVIYILTPLIVPFVWWRNRATASLELESADLRFPAIVRWGLGGLGVLGILAGLSMFAFPFLPIAIAPWKLTELTARILAGWALLSSATVLSIAFDGRWSATRIMMQSAIFGTLLTFLALPRMWTDFNPGNPMTYVFIGGIIMTLMALLVIHIWLDRLVQKV